MLVGAGPWVCDVINKLYKKKNLTPNQAEIYGKSNFFKQ